MWLHAPAQMFSVLQMAQYSPEAVAGFGVASRIESLFLVIIMGLSSITGPFVGQNWGAQKRDRVAQSLNISFRFMIYWGLTASVLLWLFGDIIVSVFDDNASVHRSALLYLYIMPITFAFLGFIMVSSSTANGMGNPKPSLVMSFMRLIGLYLPLAWLLSSEWNVAGIYLAGALANLLVGMAAVHWSRPYRQRSPTVTTT